MSNSWNDLAAVLEAARQAYAEHDESRSRALYVRATQLDPKSFDAWAGRAALSVEPDEAIVSWINVLVLVPQDQEAGAALARCVQERIDKSNSGDTERLVALGRALINVGFKSFAHKLFVRATELDERNESAWLWRGSSTSDAVEALRCMDQALALNPENRAARDARQLLLERQLPPPVPTSASPGSVPETESGSQPELASSELPHESTPSTESGSTFPEPAAVQAPEMAFQAESSEPTPQPAPVFASESVSPQFLPQFIPASDATTSSAALAPVSPPSEFVASSPEPEPTPVPVAQATVRMPPQSPVVRWAATSPKSPPDPLLFEDQAQANRTRLLMLIIAIVLLVLLAINFLSKYGYII